MSYSRDDTASLTKKINQRSELLFEAIEGQAGLQVTRKNGRELIKDEDVFDERQLRQVKKSPDELQIFTLRQAHSWTTLDISREFFECFMSTYEVFAPFWKCMFTFGIKSQENEYDFPGTSKRLGRVVNGGKKTHEFSYMMRRVEDKRRGEDEKEDWVTRQTAVYHNYVSTHGDTETTTKSAFLIVAPSPNVELQYSQYLQDATTDGLNLCVWEIHRIIVADGVRGWGDYMASLEKRLVDRSNQIIMSPLGTVTASHSPLTEYVINFEDRQDLKVIEDLIVDLLVILPTMVKTIRDIKKQYDTCCNKNIMTEEERMEYQTVSSEFEGYLDEMETHSERATILNTNVNNTTQALSDLLNHVKAEAVKAETKTMRWLAERSTKDAAAVKILTIITLVYLAF